MLADDCKENISYELSSKLVKNVCCDICLKHLNAIMETTIKSLPLDSTHQSSLNSQQMPIVSISVVDTDINSNICMCNATEAKINEGVSMSEENICPTCRNIIKAQPSARYSLVSKQTMLGDVLVNRIDSQFLSSTYSATQSHAQLRKLLDPYTPESLESHSPQTEFDEPTFINTTEDSEDILVNIREVIKVKHKPEPHNNGELNSDETEKIQNHQHNQPVSPIQLSTRLEILRRESQLECSSKKSGSGGDDDLQTKNSKSCFKCSSCTIS